MRMVFAVLLLLILSTVAQAEIVEISAGVMPEKLAAGEEFEVIVNVEIKQGYSISANSPESDFPAEIAMETTENVRFDKPTYPPAQMKTFAFADARLPVYQGKNRLIIKGKVAGNAPSGPISLKGTFSYQACDDDSCFMPETLPFSLRLEVLKPVPQVPLTIESEPPARLELEVTEQAEPAEPPEEKETPTAAAVISVEPPLAAEPLAVEQPEGNLVADLVAGKGLPMALILIFVAGIGLTLTPCVFPMIPVIVGWFTVQGSGRRGRVSSMAVLFVLGLALTYAALGMSASKAGGMLGATLQHPAALIAVAAVFIALALSMFGVYEMRPPAFIANRSGGRDGAAGMLLMGALFGMVAAPCAGPVVVALLVYVGQMGQPMLGFWMLFTLALGLGLPFFVLAVFSGALGALPQAGNWMVAVRRVFGLLLLYFALKYVAPLLPHRTADYALLAFFIFAGLYLGWLDKSMNRWRRARSLRPALGVAIALLGVWSLVSAKQVTFIPYSAAALQEARESGRPVILDFSADWCKPCEEMDKKTFANPAVVAEGKRFVWVRADLTRSGTPEVTALTKDYAIKGVPTVILIDSDGEARDRIVGFVGPEEFLDRIRSVQ